LAYGTRGKRGKDRGGVKDLPIQKKSTKTKEDSSKKKAKLAMIAGDVLGKVDKQRVARELVTAKKREKAKNLKRDRDIVLVDESDGSGSEADDEMVTPIVPSEEPLPSEINDLLKGIATKQGFKGNNQAGRYPEGIGERPERDKSGERIQQLIQHVTTKLLRSVLSKIKTNEFEVQALYVPGDDDTSMLLISSNKSSTVATLEGMYNSLAEAAIADVEGETESEKRQFSKLEHVVEDDSDDEQSRSAIIMGEEGSDSPIGQLVALVKSEEPWSQVSLDEAAGKLSSDEGGVYLVTSNNDTHAELTLMLALIRSGCTGVEAYLQGTKRPCTGCYLATRYAKEKYGLTTVKSGARPGKLFGLDPARGLAQIATAEYGDDETATPEEWAEFTDDLKRWVRTKFPKQLYVSTMSGKRDPGHDSASDSSDPSSSESSGEEDDSGESSEG
jgi:hypothetical protein